MHSDNLQNWILWRDKLFCDFFKFFYYLDCTKCKFPDFPWLFPIFIFFPDLQQNPLTFPWLLPSLEFPWLFPDCWTPCYCLYQECPQTLVEICRNLGICDASGQWPPGKIYPGFILKVDYLIICIICDTNSVNKLTLQMYTLHKYK